MIAKMKFITKFHESLFENVDHAHEKQKRMYVARKWRITFHFFEEGEVSLKMQKPRKKKSLLANWEGPYLFVRYNDGKIYQEHDNGTICIFKDNKGQTWQRAEWDLHIYHATLGMNLWGHNFSMLGVATYVT
jgi:hypothetical protein